MDPELETALTRFASSVPVLVALDFDGVLAPIVTRPEDARATPAARRALDRLAGAPGVTTAIVSGRPLAELRDLAGPPDAVLLVGSHGAQRSSAEVLLDDRQRTLLSRLGDELDRVSAGLPHTRVERKEFAAVLHTRPALEAGLPRTYAQASAATRPLRDLPGVYLTEGKEVLEFSVVDSGEHNKGVALRDLATRANVRATLFVGDDVTDEAGFAVLDDDAGDLTVRVVPPDAVTPTLARHTVPDPDAVASLLHRLADLLTADRRGN
ncbi:MAG: hypothetical protein QG622_2709 [Actinomycetota bacterium]|nr:hypothetical protein [Actinomycetota bacterium]